MGSPQHAAGWAVARRAGQRSAGRDGRDRPSPRMLPGHRRPSGPWERSRHREVRKRHRNPNGEGWRQPTSWRPTTPQCEAGRRPEPPPSVPSAIGGEAGRQCSRHHRTNHLASMRDSSDDARGRRPCFPYGPWRPFPACWSCRERCRQHSSGVRRRRHHAAA